jgi:SLOG in TRPM, prokaryote
LTNGHSHFFLLGDENHKFEWGDEAQIKFDLAQRIAVGRNKFGSTQQCKMVTVLLGDNPQCYNDIELVRINIKFINVFVVYLKTYSYCHPGGQ